MSTTENSIFDREDLEDQLKKVEKSFDIRFAKNELSEIKTFGELCDHIITKLNLVNVSDSTVQQAFYKLREAIVSTLEIDKTTIQVDTKLEDVFPRIERRKQIKDLEFELGFKLKILRPNLLIEAVLILTTLGSFVFMFFHLVYGIEILVGSILLTNLAFTFGKEFNTVTVGDLAKKVTKENYRKSRRNPKTINEAEVVEQLLLIFGEIAERDQKITRDTKL